MSATQAQSRVGLAPPTDRRQTDAQTLLMLQRIIQQTDAYIARMRKERDDLLKERDDLANKLEGRLPIDPEDDDGFDRQIRNLTHDFQFADVHPIETFDQRLANDETEPTREFSDVH